MISLKYTTLRMKYSNRKPQTTLNHAVNEVIKINRDDLRLIVILNDGKNENVKKGHGSKITLKN